MVSEQSPVVTEPSLQPSQHVHDAPTSQLSSSDGLESTARANPLKRGREDSPNPLSPAPEEPNHKNSRFALRTTSPIQITAAVAALEADRRRREDLGQELSAVHDLSSNSALESLIRSNAAMSQPTDAHTTTAPTAAMDTAERPASPAPTPISIPMSSAEMAPSTSTVLGADGDPSHVGDPGVHGATVTASPTPMDIDPDLEQAQAAQHAEKTASASLSYPGPLHVSGPMGAPTMRNMSYPLPASGQASPTSSGSQPKKHKCPDCDTVFTRQHNLKSHQLTHKDEKPFKCDHCEMRFRRLHDLKRHSKLHTGEKPHVCPKCDRKFARGDALARHSKGAGGCAGRRSSMGTFIEDELNTGLTDANDARLHDPRMHASSGDDMHGGALYAKYAADAAIAEEERMRRQSLPNMKAPQGAGSEGNPEGAPASQTHVYPPGGPSRNASGLYPPGADRNSVSTTTPLGMPGSTAGSGCAPTTDVSSVPVGSGNGYVYSQGEISESPAHLSPSPGPGGGFHDLPRVPEHPGEDPHDPIGHVLSGLTRPQQYARRDTDRRTPPNIPLSAGTGDTPKHLTDAGADGRYATAGQNGPTSPQSANRAGSGMHALDNSNNMFAGDIPGLWAYTHSLEERVSQMEKADREKQAMIATLANSLEMLQRQVGHFHEEEAVGP